VQEEVAKNEKAAAIATESVEEKRERDQMEWKSWLRSYQDRLAREIGAGQTNQARKECMNLVNPKVVLRNWVAQVAIDEAKEGSYETVRSWNAHLPGLKSLPWPLYDQFSVLCLKV
jgi:uncharacterized protein YdiU (UPF0061 family)